MPSPTHSDPAFSSEGSGALSKGSSDKQTKLTSHLQSQGYKQSKLYICCQYMPSWHGQVLLNLFSIIIKKSSAKITFTQTQTTVFRSYNLDIQDFFRFSVRNTTFIIIVFFVCYSHKPKIVCTLSCALHISMSAQFSQFKRISVTSAAGLIQRPF